MDLQAEVSIMKMRRRVADIESSSKGEVALLEELEDEQVNFSMSSSCNLCIFTCLHLTVVLFFTALGLGLEVMPLPYCRADIGYCIEDL